MPLPHEAESPAKSPAKSTLSSPPRPGVQAFFFSIKKEENKTHGFTPNGKTLIRLKRFEGASHHRVRAEDDPATILSEDTKLESPQKHDPEQQRLLLDAYLIDLKKRTDTDYEIYTKKKVIDAAHFEAAVQKIDTNIEQLKRCYQRSPSPDEFIKELNQQLSQGKIYNPFGLKKIYEKSGYQVKLAKDVTIYTAPFDANLLKPKPIANAAPAQIPQPAFSGGLYDDLPPLKNPKKLFDSKSLEPEVDKKESDTSKPSSSWGL
jgi:hypothetical protein